MDMLPSGLGIWSNGDAGVNCLRGGRSGERVRSITGAHLDSKAVNSSEGSNDDKKGLGLTGGYKSMNEVREGSS